MKLIVLLPLLLIAVISLFSGTDQQLVLAQSRTASSHQTRFAKVRVPQTSIFFPKLTRFKDKRVLKDVNRQIDELTREFGCDDNGDKRSSDDYKVRSKVDYADKDVFSIYASASYYCGGPFPTNDSNISVTFDLRTGRQIEFEELFDNYEANKREIMEIIFAKQIERAKKVAASGKPKSDTCEGNADLYSLEHLEESTYSYSLSRAGVRVQPQWPHVIEACAELITVPYDRLMKFVALEGLLRRIGR